MLRQLSISNYALIDSAELVLHEGFTAITGETGAGKSIMLGALSLILGQRSDTSAIRDKTQKCVVEAHFYLNGYQLEQMFEEADVDYDVETVIRREILPSGKSRAFINDTPVTLPFLKDLTQKLIDIHSQHQNLLLGDGLFQLNVVDIVANNKNILQEYQQKYHVLRELERDREALMQMNNQQKADRDYWDFQFNQLQSAELQVDEQELVEQEVEQLSHVEEIKLALANAGVLLNEHEFPLVDGMHQVVNEIKKISDFLSGGDELLSRLESVYIELKDIAGEVSVKASELEFDPVRLQRLQDRLNLIYELQQKHQKNSIGELLELKGDLESKLLSLDSFDEKLKKLDDTIEKEKEIVEKMASRLSQSRKDVFEKIESTITDQLHELGMPHARFSVEHELLEVFTRNGVDEIKFLFSANKSGELADIPKVASGGELSRLMLCIKSLLSSAKRLPTIIFDEIDTGVSGEIADKMGRIMQQMGNSIQVISITHLPQIAGKGQHHFKVFKSEESDRTVSHIRLLSDEERIREIAGMLSGAKLSDAAIHNAKDLLKN
ncbi:DNA repair protein RecN [Natronoflexus pectinivorans]|uniref:DNA repair protein RecN n=1 Tax=Natronoflexus pectinivorans TaxID=682526 RepID=A0A4R2GK84_9BACT|nr:DNA repair protein RecN [Natronoflexus pectinivorans]TCO08884.1 DNA repair protein RecN (Recombination protein N) [Natronoflexus pectinivorans]